MSVQTIKDADLNELRRLARAHVASLVAAEQSRAALEAERQRLHRHWQAHYDQMTEGQQDGIQGSHLDAILNELDIELDAIEVPESVDGWLALKGR